MLCTTTGIVVSWKQCTQHNHCRDKRMPSMGIPPINDHVSDTVTAQFWGRMLPGHCCMTWGTLSFVELYFMHWHYGSALPNSNNDLVLTVFFGFV